jgi:hypothetical protein
MECQAEVFRRSEKRIKERKQRRNHILMACVPVVFCAALLFALKPIMPSDQKTEPEDTTQQESTGLPESGGMMASNSVAVIGSGFSNNVTMLEDFQAITGIIESITTGSGDRNNATTDEPLYGDASDVDGAASDVAGAAPMSGGYLVTVIGEDGTETVYRLDGLSLVNQTTNERFLMDAETGSLLNNALGIPQD